MNSFFKIINVFKLDNYLEKILINNDGNCNPYHNFFHIQTIIKNIYLISKYENIKNSELRLILIAGLFHDFNHSAGKLKDSENIKIAIDSFRKYSKETSKNNIFVENLIKKTEYPYKENEELTIFEKIIRDSDVLQTCEVNYIQQCCFGLNKELTGKEMITSKVFENELNFLKNVKIFTNKGKEIFEKNISSIIQDCEYIINLINQ